MKSKLITAAVVLVVLLGALIWWRQSASQRKVARATEEFKNVLAEQLDEAAPAGGSPQPVKVEAVEAIGELNEDELDDFTEAMVPNIMQMMFDKYERILKLPPEERNKQLDQIIDEQVAARDQIQKLIDGDADSAEIPAPGIQGRVRVQRTQNADGTEEVGASRVVDSQTDDGQRFMADNTTPEQRAIMDEYVNLLRERMKARGIDPEKTPIAITMSFEAEGP